MGDLPLAHRFPSISVHIDSNLFSQNAKKAGGDKRAEKDGKLVDKAWDKGGLAPEHCLEGQTGGLLGRYHNS